jgi:MFS transporter, PPP family, 3-phenylpropionic acid transporter
LLRRPSNTAAVHGLFLLFGLVVAAFFPFLALYLESHGLTPSEIGVTLAIMAVARIVANPVWGHLADATLGRRTALQIGALGAAAAAILLDLADGVPAVGAAGAALAAFMVSTGPNIDSIALEHLGADRMADYGRIRGWESLSYAGACFALGLVLESLGVRWAMTAYAIACLAVVAWSFTVERDRPHRLVGHGRLGTVGAVFRAAPRLWGFLAAAFLVWTGFNAAWNFIGLRIADRGGGPLLIGVGTALGGLVEVPMMRGSSRWQRRFGLRTLYAAGCAVYALAFILWGSISDPRILAVLTVFEGMAFALLFTTGVVIVGRLVPSTLYSTGNSISQMVAFGLGPILGAGIGGFVYQRVGAFALFASASLLALAAAGVALLVLNTPLLTGPPEEVDPARLAEASGPAPP